MEKCLQGDCFLFRGSICWAWSRCNRVGGSSECHSCNPHKTEGAISLVKPVADDELVAVWGSCDKRHLQQKYLNDILVKCMLIPQHWEQCFEVLVVTMLYLFVFCVLGLDNASLSSCIVLSHSQVSQTTLGLRFTKHISLVLHWAKRMVCSPDENSRH